MMFIYSKLLVTDINTLVVVLSVKM
jgi:hypothetical protein